MESSGSILSTKDCETILENSLQRNNFMVTSFNITSLSDKIEGFLGEHYFVTILYVDKDKAKTSNTQRCFMKVLNGSSKLIFEILVGLNAYNKEEFFYTYLMKEFAKYNIDASFSPKGYFCKPYLLVLEDMSQLNFVCISDKSRFLDMDHCKIGLQTLAKMHASGMLYESVKSEEQRSAFSLVQKFPKMFEDILNANDDNLAQQWMQKSIEAVFTLIPIVSEKYNLNEHDFSSRLGVIVHSFDNLSNYFYDYKGTILHGDPWFNNFMFKYDGEVVAQSILCDYQFLKYGPPSVDVLHFLYANTRKQFRDDHFDELIEFYYKELKRCLPTYDLELHLPKVQYLHLCNSLKLLLKVQCICDRSLTMLDDEFQQAVVDDEILKQNLFDRRIEKFLDSYKGNAFFHEVITEDMLELYELLQ